MFYWLVLILIVGTTFFIKKDSKLYLIAALCIFGVGAILRIIGFSEVSEILMRIDLIFWIIGLVKAYKELS